MKDERAIQVASTGVESLREDVDRTRAGMASTIRALEEKLDPSDLRDKAAEELEKVEVRVKAAVREEILEVKAVLKEELQEAKAAVKDVIATAKVDALAVKDSVKDDITKAIDDAKTSARAATLGRLEDIATQAGDAMNDTKDTLIDTVRQNPVPAALVGFGLAWLLMNRSSTASGRDRDRSSRSTSRNGYRPGEGSSRREGARGTDVVADVKHRVADVASDAKDAAGNALGMVRDTTQSVLHQAVDATGRLAHDVGDQASSMAHRAAEYGTHVAHDAKDVASHLVDDATHAGERAFGQAKRAEQAVETYYMGNPLAIGAAVLAGGALLGMVLPRTDREDELLGETRDQLFEGAKSAAHDAFGKAHELGEEAARTVKGALAQSTTA